MLVNKDGFPDKEGFEVEAWGLQKEFFRPKYDFELKEWIETATEAEIDEINKIDICPEPTDKERITKLEEEKSILAENVYQLASIMEIMLGGSEDGQTEATTTDTAN